MRLHHLSMTGFGPFAGSEQVDFDELCDAGLFLLTGPTGAGKTTVLDAVCFALYGTVPGVRGVKALKSQHSPDDLRPEVVLDFSVRDRRFVLRRTPEWTRPKRRGAGFTTENASATLVEKTSGDDRLLSSRAQEVGHLVGDLIGMQSTQFVQVAMLPQGDFQKFLRASSQDRHDVLQHLFRTDRYARIEEWVHDHSRGWKERSAAGRQAVVRVLDTMADRAGVELPENLSGESLEAPEARQQALAWADTLVAAADATRSVVDEEHRGATTAAAAARAAHDAAVQVHALRQRREQAREVLADLAARTADEQEARAALDADRRAAGCMPLLQIVDETREHHALLADAWSTASSDLAGLDDTLGLPPVPPTVEALADAEQHARAAASRLEALLPRERELVEARARAAGAEAELIELSESRSEASARAVSLPTLLEDARARAATAGTVAGRADALTLELEQARRCLEAAESARRCADSLPELRGAERDARDRAADARQLVQDLTARRLAGIAAELAGKLADGQPCQVCGSTVHPDKAARSSSPVTEAEQAAADAGYDAASDAHAEATGAVLQAEERLDGLRRASGGLEPAAAATEVAAAEAALEEAVHARADLEQAERRIQELSDEQAAAADTLHDLAVRLATVTELLENARRTAAAAYDALSTEGVADLSLGDRIVALAARADAFAEAREALCELESAAARVEEADTRLAEAARANGFENGEGVGAAVLTEHDRRRWEDLLESRAQAASTAQAVLDEVGISGLDEEQLPDLDAAAADADEAERAVTASARILHAHEETVAALRRLRVRLEKELASWAPVLTEFVRADSMSKLVRGMGADNQLQMRLSAYVLATRLDQVVAAANERLAHMRDQRYLLQRTGRVTRKGSQAGLGLEVVDQWTGDVRDPVTLSGGETFVVSLALALGLADVVTQEAGGTEIETLFVDEGFGTLDADTLDDVMDRLDDLRAGGRAVGVVSHVSELRNRIPTQLHVEKRRTGSVVTVRTAVG